MRSNNQTNAALEFAIQRVALATAVAFAIVAGGCIAAEADSRLPAGSPTSPAVESVGTQRSSAQLRLFVVVSGDRQAFPVPNPAILDVTTLPVPMVPIGPGRAVETELVTPRTEEFAGLLGQSGGLLGAFFE